MCAGVRSIRLAAMRMYSPMASGEYSPRRHWFASRCAFHHVQWMQLQAVHAQRQHRIEAGVIVRVAFAGQAEDQVGAHRNAALSGGCHSVSGIPPDRARD